MRRRISALVLALFVALSLIGGCTQDGGDTGTNGTSEYPPQEGLEVGAQAPEFRVQNQDQTIIKLSDYKGLKNVVLVFYPAAFTPV